MSTIRPTKDASLVKVLAIRKRRVVRHKVGVGDRSCDDIVTAVELGMPIQYVIVPAFPEANDDAPPGTRARTTASG